MTHKKHSAIEEYLYKRENCWYIRITLPEKLGGKMIRKSLHTSNLLVARKFRDKYILPLYHYTSSLEILEFLKISALQNTTEAERIIANIEDDQIEDLLVSEAIEKYFQYLNNNGLKAKSIKGYISACSIITSCFPDMLVNSLNKKIAIQILDMFQANKLNPTTIKFKFQSWRAFLKWCIKCGYCRSNIINEFDIPLPRVNKQHTTPIPQQLADIAVTLLGNWTLAPRIARYTGMRLNEVLTLTSDHIITEHGILSIRISEEIAKNKSARIVPIAEKLLPYMNDLSELSQTGKKNDKWNREIKKNKGCEKCSFHSWRSYAISEMMRAGVDSAVRKKITGHKDNKDDIHEMYTHVQIEEMKLAVDKIP